MKPASVPGAGLPGPTFSRLSGRPRLALGIGLLLVGFALSALYIPAVAGSVADRIAQEEHDLTWARLLDNKPSVIAFSSEFATDRLALFGSSNKDLQHGIWRSTDGGSTWIESSTGITESKEIDVYDIVFSPDFAADRTVFASVNKQKVTLREAPGALFRSTDGGETWQELTMVGFPARGVRPMQDLSSLSLSPDFGSDGTMFAVVAAVGVYRSTDRGATWMQLSIENANQIEAAPTYPSERLVAVATANSGLLLSTDGGDTWSPPGESLAGIRTFKQVIFSKDFAVDRAMLVMSPTDGIFMSRDAGATWQNIVRPPENAQVLAIAATPDFASGGALAYALKDSRVYLSTDGGQNWEDTASVPILGTQTVTIVLPPDYASSRILYAVSVYNGLYRYYPVASGSQVALTVTAEAVNAAATAEALPTALARQEAQRAEDFTETGCIAYYIPPVMLIGVWALRSASRRATLRGRDEG